MKKIISVMLVIILCVFSFFGCGKTELDKNNPVTLTMWHLYGEQADSPMNKLVEEFNQTVGLDKGIIINVTGMTSISHIADKLAEAQSDKAGTSDMPDLFFSQKNGALTVGTENLINWYELFDKKDFADFVLEFLTDGEINGGLYVLPIAKSTNLLYICGTQFERFSSATGVTYDSLSDWDGFFDAAAKYYEWSGGKTFSCFDFPLLLAELAAKSVSNEPVHKEDGTYNFENKAFESFFMRFAKSLAKGHIALSDLYSNTQLMTGEVMTGIGSSAAILYYNDTVTYPDNTQEPMNLEILPVPQLKEAKKPMITQAGAGMCAVKTTAQKAEASSVFAKWFLDPERNLDFAAICGYMPATVSAFDKIKSSEFENKSYQKLYSALNKSIENCTAVSEQENPAYYSILQNFYGYLRDNQKDIAKRYSEGTDAEILKQEIWEQLKSAK